MGKSVATWVSNFRQERVHPERVVLLGTKPSGLRYSDDLRSSLDALLSVSSDSRRQALDLAPRRQVDAVQRLQVNPKK